MLRIRKILKGSFRCIGCCRGCLSIFYIFLFFLIWRLHLGDMIKRFYQTEKKMCVNIYGQMLIHLYFTVFHLTLLKNTCSFDIFVLEYFIFTTLNTAIKLVIWMTQNNKLLVSKRIIATPTAFHSWIRLLLACAVQTDLLGMTVASNGCARIQGGIN